MLLPGILLAQGQILGAPPPGPPPPPYGTVYEFNRDIKLELSIRGYAEPGKKISGTNENFTVAAGPTGFVPGDPVWQGNDGWNFVEVIYWRLFFSAGGYDYYFDPEEHLYWIEHGVRLSTTHFANGALQIKVDAIFELSRIADPEDVEYVPMSTTVDVVVHNKGLLLATKEKWGLTDQEIQNGPPFPPDHWVEDDASPPAMIAASCMPRAKSGLESMNHEVEPSTTAAAQNQRQSDLASKFKRKTVFYTVTHGTTNPNGIRSSYGDTMPWQNTPGCTSVADMCLTGRTDPPYNLVILICCTGVTNGAWNLTSSAFGINYDPNNQNNNSKDRCCLAFTAPVATDRGNPVSLPLWTEKFLSYQSQGYTVEDAIVKINADISQGGDNIKIYPVGEGGAMVPIRAGDPLTKLKGAYLTPSREAPWLKIRF